MGLQSKLRLGRVFKILVPILAILALFVFSYRSGSYAVDTRLPGPDGASDGAAKVLAWDWQSDGCRHGLDSESDCEICSGELPYMPLEESLICTSQSLQEDGQFVYQIPSVKGYGLELAYVYREFGSMLDAQASSWFGDVGDVFLLECRILKEGHSVGWCFQSVEIVSDVAETATDEASLDESVDNTSDDIQTATGTGVLDNNLDQNPDQNADVASEEPAAPSPAPIEKVSAQAADEARAVYNGKTETGALQDVWFRMLGESKGTCSVTLLKDVSVGFDIGLDSNVDGLDATLNLNGHTLTFTNRRYLTSWMNRDSSTSTFRIYGGSATPNVTRTPVSKPGESVTDVVRRKMVYYSRDWDESGSDLTWYRYDVDFSGMGCIYGQGASAPASSENYAPGLVVHSRGNMVMQNVLLCSPSGSDGNKDPYAYAFYHQKNAGDLTLQNCGILGFGQDGSITGHMSTCGVVLEGTGLNDKRVRSFSKVYISGVEAGSSSGGVGIRMNHTGDVSFSDVVVSDCDGRNFGGGISVLAGSRAIFGGTCAIVGNHSTNSGGGIFVHYSDDEKLVGQVVNNGRLCIGNNYSGHGGGLYMRAGSVKSYGSNGGFLDVSGNRADTNGGGIFFQDADRKNGIWSDLSFQNLYVDGNVAGSSGGGIYVGSHGLHMVSSKISNNIAEAGDGGGIFVSKEAMLKKHYQESCGLSADDARELYFNSLVVEGNQAPKGNGGGMCFLSNGYWSGFYSLIPVGRNTQVRNNQSAYGGGVYADNYVKLDLNGVSISKNHSTNDGGGLYLDVSSHTEGFGLTVEGNRSDGRGGGVYSVGGGLSHQHSSFLKNESQSHGGGLFLRKGTLVLTDCSVSENVSVQGNGGGMALDCILGDEQDGPVDATEFDTDAWNKYNPVAVTLLSTRIVSNQAVNRHGSKDGSCDGGGIYVGEGSHLQLDRGHVYSVNAVGGIVLSGSKESTVTENQADGHGGGIYLKDGGFIQLLQDTAIQKNTCDLGGGGIFWEEGEFQMVPDPDYVGTGSETGSDDTNVPMVWRKSGRICVSDGIKLSKNVCTNGSESLSNLELCYGRYLESLTSSSNQVGYQSGMISVGYNVGSVPDDSADDELVLCQYPAGVHVSNLGLSDYFHSDYEEFVPMASTVNQNLVVFMLKYDHVRHASSDEIGYYVSYDVKGALRQLFERAMEPSLDCRHGYETVDHCGICSQSLSNLNGDLFPGCCVHGNPIRTCTVCASGSLDFGTSPAFLWDDAITVDSNGYADLLEGVFDGMVSTAPAYVFDENLQPVELKFGRYAMLERKSKYLVEYLVTLGDGSLGYLLRPVFVLSPDLFEGDDSLVAPDGATVLRYPEYPEAVLPTGDPECVYFLQDGDYYGTAASCVARLMNEGGSISLLKDAFSHALLVNADRPSGLFLNGFTLSLGETVYANSTLGVLDGARIFSTERLGGESAPVWRNNVLSFGEPKADDTGFLYHQVAVDTNHAGGLVFEGRSDGSPAFSVTGNFGLSGVRVETGVYAGIEWDRGRNQGDILSCMFVGTGFGDGFAISNMVSDLQLSDAWFYGYERGIVMGSSARSYPRVGLNRCGAVGMSGSGFSLENGGSGAYTATSCWFSYNGNHGMDLSKGVSWDGSLVESHVDHNQSLDHGGGVLLGSKLSITGSSLCKNAAKGSGGALALLQNGKLQLPMEDAADSDYCGNYCEGNGGAIAIPDSDSIVTNADMDMRIGYGFGNMAGNRGGFLYLNGSPNIAPAMFYGRLVLHDNQAGAEGGGGAIYSTGMQFLLPEWFDVYGNFSGSEKVNDDVMLRSEYQILVHGEIPEGCRIGVTVSKRPSSLRFAGIAETVDGSPVLSGYEAFVLQGSLAGNDLYQVGVGKLASTIVVRVRGTEGTMVPSALVNVQFMATVKILPDTPPANMHSALKVIDTSGGDMPKNLGTGTDVTPNGNSLKSIYLDVDGNVLYEEHQIEIFSPWSYDLREGDCQWVFDRFSGHGYNAVELWVQPPGGDSSSQDPADWVVYPYSENQRFSLSGGSGCIPFEEGSVIRIVAHPVESEREQDVSFFDYDISNGYVYTSESNAYSDVNRGFYSQYASGSSTIWSNVDGKGINSSVNYPSVSGSQYSKFAFGNANTNTGFGRQIWTKTGEAKGFYLNAFNSAIPAFGSKGNFEGCCYGMVDGISGGVPVFSDNVLCPDLFGDETVVGKTKITNANGKNSKGFESLTFYTRGYRNVLTGVTDNPYAEHLDKFSHPGIYDGVQHKTMIWTNNFWPMDFSNTTGGDGHDAVWGSAQDSSRLMFAGRNNDTLVQAPITSLGSKSDDGLNRNSYFGMKTSFVFSMPRGYSGPLEFLFYGDDDLWVFLDGKLVCDIGGVHRSVGEYVNFWDYIRKDDTRDHLVEIFYLERGASGSSCWMQYMLPNVRGKGEVPEQTIRITKELGNEPPEGVTDYVDDFSFRLLANAGGDVSNMVPYVGEYRVNGRVMETSNGVLGPIEAGSSVLVEGVPVGTVFLVEEYWGEGGRPPEYDDPVIRILDNSAMPVEGATGEVVADADVLVEVENFFMETWDFGIIKYDAGSGSKLSDVGFEITPIDDDWNPIGDPVDLVTCDGTTSLHLSGLGRWLLKETAPLDGYVTGGPWVVVSNQTGDVDVFELSASEDGGYTLGASCRLSYVNDVYSFYCPNSKPDSVPSLPETGGFVLWLQLLGAAILLSAGVRLVMFRQTRI